MWPSTAAQVSLKLFFALVTTLIPVLAYDLAVKIKVEFSAISEGQWDFDSDIDGILKRNQLTAIQILLLEWIENWKNARPEMKDVDFGGRMLDEDIFVALDYRQLLFGTGLRLLEEQREHIVAKWTGLLDLGEEALMAVVDEVGIDCAARFQQLVANGCISKMLSAISAHDVIVTSKLLVQTTDFEF
jgi:hypothetical protein